MATSLLRTFLIIAIALTVVLPPAIPLVHAQSKSKGTSHGIVTLTFDDGYQNIYDNAYPILIAHRFNASLFMITGLSVLEGSPLMTLTELNSLHASGWEIDSHSVTHSHLPNLAPKDIYYEVATSRQWIINHDLGTPVAFSYPYGKYNFFTVLCVEKFYSYARTMKHGLNNLPCKNKYTLETYPLWGTPTKGSLRICEKKTAEGIAKGQWTIITIHGVVPPTDMSKVNAHYLWTTTETLNDYASFLTNHAIDVETFSQLSK